MYTCSHLIILPYSVTSDLLILYRGHFLVLLFSTLLIIHFQNNVLYVEYYCRNISVFFFLLNFVNKSLYTIFHVRHSTFSSLTNSFLRPTATYTLLCMYGCVCTKTYTNLS